MKKTRRTILLVLLFLLAAGFIFSNSLESRAESSVRSGAVVARLKPLLDPEGRIPRVIFHAWVRKTAHFVEFWILGLCLGGLAKCLTWQRGRAWAAALTAAFVVACTDETIQHFTGRSDSLADVLLDTFGAACGLLTAEMIGLAVCWVRRRQRRI